MTAKLPVRSHETVNPVGYEKSLKHKTKCWIKFFFLSLKRKKKKRWLHLSQQNMIRIKSTSYPKWGIQLDKTPTKRGWKESGCLDNHNLSKIRANFISFSLKKIWFQPLTGQPDGENKPVMEGKVASPVLTVLASSHTIKSNVDVEVVSIKIK